MNSNTLRECLMKLGEFYNAVKCPICLEPIQNLHQLRCGHKFCVKCFEIYRQNQKQILCPICKKIARKERSQDDEIEIIGKNLSQANSVLKEKLNCDIIQFQSAKAVDTVLMKMTDKTYSEQSKKSSKSCLVYNSKPEATRKLLKPCQSSVSCQKQKPVKKSEPGPSNIQLGIQTRSKTMLKKVILKDAEIFPNQNQTEAFQDSFIKYMTLDETSDISNWEVNRNNKPNTCLVKDAFDKLINAPPITYTNKQLTNEKEVVLDLNDKTIMKTFQWLNDDKNEFNKCTQSTQSEVISLDHNYSQSIFDMSSVSQINNYNSDNNKITVPRDYQKNLNKLQARSLNIQITKVENKPNTKLKRHSISGDTASEDYYIDDNNSDEIESNDHLGKAVIDIMEDEFLDVLDNDILEKKRKQNEQKKDLSGWRRIEKMRKTMERLSKEPKKLNITLQSVSTQNQLSEIQKNGNTEVQKSDNIQIQESGNAEMDKNEQVEIEQNNLCFNLNVMENYFAKIMPKLLQTEKDDENIYENLTQKIDDDKVNLMKNSFDDQQNNLVLSQTYISPTQEINLENSSKRLLSEVTETGKSLVTKLEQFLIDMNSKNTGLNLNNFNSYLIDIKRIFGKLDSNLDKIKEPDKIENLKLFHDIEVQTNSIELLSNFTQTDTIFASDVNSIEVQTDLNERVVENKVFSNVKIQTTYNELINNSVQTDNIPQPEIKEIEVQTDKEPENLKLFNNVEAQTDCFEFLNKSSQTDNILETKEIQIQTDKYECLDCANQNFKVTDKVVEKTDDKIETNINELPPLIKINSSNIRKINERNEMNLEKLSGRNANNLTETTEKKSKNLPTLFQINQNNKSKRIRAIDSDDDNADDITDESNKRPCNKFIQNLSVSFDSNIESCPRQESLNNFKFSESENYEQCMEELFKKYENNEEEKENILEPPPKRSRTQEILDECHFTIENVSKTRNDFIKANLITENLKKQIVTTHKDYINPSECLKTIDHNLNKANTSRKCLFKEELHVPNNEINYNQIFSENVIQNNPYSESLFSESDRKIFNQSINEFIQASREVEQQIYNTENILEIRNESNIHIIENIVLKPPNEQQISYKECHTQNNKNFNKNKNEPEVDILQNILVNEPDIITIEDDEEGDDTKTILSDEILLSDVDIVETTPQKLKGIPIQERLSLKKQFSLDLTLPPPLEFQDVFINNTESNDTTLIDLDRTVCNANQNIGLEPVIIQRKPLSPINQIGTSTPHSNALGVSQVTALSLSPISSNKFQRYIKSPEQLNNTCLLDNESLINSQEYNQYNLGPLELAKEAKCLPLIVTKTRKKSSNSVVTKQQSILDFMKPSQGNESIASTSSHSSQLSKPCLAFTRLNKHQVNHILGLANRKLVIYSSEFNQNVTHMIVSVNENGCVVDHTIKFISAIATGIWVLSSEWVEKCLQENCIVSEEPYEALDISGLPGPRQSRLMRTTNPLFKGFKIYVTEGLMATNRKDFESVIKSLGGITVSKPEDLFEKNNCICLIVTEAAATEDMEIYDTWLEILKVATVDLEWVSRSVGQYKLLSLKPFSLSSDEYIDQLGYPPELCVDIPPTC